MIRGATRFIGVFIAKEKNKIQLKQQQNEQKIHIQERPVTYTLSQKNKNRSQRTHQRFQRTDEKIGNGSHDIYIRRI
jgi:hypothetical protein